MDDGIIIIGDCYYNTFKNFAMTSNIKVLRMPPNPYLAEPIKYHADMSVLRVDDTVFMSRYLIDTEIHLELKNIGYSIQIPDVIQKSSYPDDVQFNVCLVGKNAIINPNTAAAEIMQYISQKGYRIIPCNQGYTKCSVCVIDNNSIITADSAIHDSAIINGVDSLLISPGYISLPGYNYGFIGGSSFRLNQSVYFSGSITKHPDFDRIVQFITEHKLNICQITPKPLFDFGGSIIL